MNVRYGSDIIAEHRVSKSNHDVYLGVSVCLFFK
jgi:hypothetical protein